VVHRDIKPANIMYADPSHEAIMLVDFGCAGLPTFSPQAVHDGIEQTACASGDSRTKIGRTGDPAVLLHKVIGTTMYMAPEFFVPRTELLEGQQSSSSAEPVSADVLDLEPEEMEAAARGIEYDEGVDIWALGVVAFELLFGTFPMDAQWETELEAKIARGALRSRHGCDCCCCSAGLTSTVCLATGVWEFPSESDGCPSVSEPAKAMIRASMTVDRRKRLSADELLRHPWLQDGQAVAEHSESSVAAADYANPNLVLTAVCLDKAGERPAEGTPPLGATRCTPVPVSSVSCASQSDLCPEQAGASATVAEGTPPTPATIQTVARALSPILSEPETTTSARVGSGLGLATGVSEGTPPPPSKGDSEQPDREVEGRCASENSEDADESVGLSLPVHRNQAARCCSVELEPLGKSHSPQQQHPGPDPEPELDLSSSDEEFEECHPEL